MNDTASSPFAAIPSAPADPILGIKQKVEADPNPKRVDLSVGVYQNEKGETPCLASVQDAFRRLLTSKQSAGYLPIDGLPEFVAHVQQMVFGPEAAVLSEKRVATVQSVGGTSALRYGADFLRRYYADATVYVSDPTWANHQSIFERAGFRVATYPYYDNQSHTVKFPALLEAVKNMPPRSILLLHACCHNPTGVDLTPEQWDELIAVLRNSTVIPFVDFAYQGFGSGLGEDAVAVRKMADAGLFFLLATSYSKNFSLYRRRVGTLSIITGSQQEAQNVLSQLKTDIRTNNSNPPVDGAAAVNIILSDRELREQWEGELQHMRNRIQTMRAQFVDLLKKAGTGETFEHMRTQHGMFSYTGLTKEQVQKMQERFSIYTVGSGRICIAALNPGNVQYVAEAVASVVKEG